MSARIRNVSATSAPEAASPGAPIQFLLYHVWIAAHYLHLRKQPWRRDSSASIKATDAAERVAAAWGISPSSVRQFEQAHRAESQSLADNFPDAFLPNWVAVRDSRNLSALMKAEVSQDGMIDQSCIAQYIRMFRWQSDPQIERMQIESFLRIRPKRR